MINHQNHLLAKAKISTWPEFAPTPFVRIGHTLTQSIGVASIHAKLEGSRCGLSSFKALGGGYAVDVLADQSHTSNASTASNGTTVTTASAGNHGIAVAWGARRRGLRCIVYVHAGVGPTARAKMQSYGSEVVVCEGDYSASVEQCKKDAKQNGWHILQDVSWEQYEQIPKRIWQGYSIVASEIISQLQLDNQPIPTHVLINGGVGGFACSMCGHLWEQYGAHRPRFICVEPLSAACLSLSATTGVASTVVSDGTKATPTLQTGLDCSSAAPLAWEVLREGCNDFVAISDDVVGPCMRILAEQGIIAGASAVAGLGVLLVAGNDPVLKEKLGLTAQSRVVFVVCEGAVEEELYFKLVGTSAQELREQGAVE